MITFKQYLKEGYSKSIFDDDYKPSKVIKIDPPTTREVTLDLYRGFDADLNNLELREDKYILSPHKSEQEAIWFSQWLKDAKGRGEWILKYQLPVISHYQRKHTEDGDYFDTIPEEISGKSDPYENSPIYGGIELPDGWLWSYKTQKYIIATKPIAITKDMIKRDSDYDEEF